MQGTGDEAGALLQKAKLLHWFQVSRYLTGTTF